jgi:hypothetical protein
MRGIRGDPVEVWLRNGRPARFVWRGRMHTVIFVLDRQVRSAATPAGPAPSGSPANGSPASVPPSSDPATSGTEGTEGIECWRVEATPERTVPPATYELCRDLATGRWQLFRD